jgi:O-methyltransferase domain
VARVALVDVGGGHGACLKQILDKHPHLETKKCVLQGTPEVIKIAKSDGNLPADLEHDFRTEQPVEGLY